MRVAPVNFTRLLSPTVDRAQQAQSPSIGRAVRAAVEQVNDLQIRADREAERLATGQADNLHHALISMQKAHVALQLTAQVTRRAVQAYQEIMRLQA
ncbi:MAG: flagellar hook-basal body complex protein FliE [Armatimonadota bacterium]